MLRLLRRRQREREHGAETLDLFYASDVHGSERCWRKFLGAGRFYGAQAVIMGGDITGKAIVPVACDADGRFSARFLGEERTGSGDRELEELLDAIRFNGMYPWVATPGEVERYTRDGAAREALFERIMLDELRRWIELADERARDTGIATYVMAGNDDPWSCDAVLEQASVVRPCDGRILLVGTHELLSSSYANPTPWNSPRELEEDALYAKLKALAEQLERPETSIFNLHVPPYDTGLDTANELNPDLTLRYVGGSPHPIPVGSHAVRQLLEEYQPLLALHGHIHESKGEVRIGRTLALNPGSEYNSGHIHGVLIRLGETDVLRHQFVVG